MQESRTLTTLGQRAEPTREGALERELFEIRRRAEREHVEKALWPGYFEIRHLDFLALLPFLPRQSYARVLEIGCGMGYYTAFLSRMAEVVVAIDLVETNVETQTPGLRLARDFVTALGIENVALCGASVEKLPFPDGSFDLVLSNHVLEHVPDRTRAVREMHRVLAPGGYNVCVVPTRGDRLYTLPWYHAYLVKRTFVHAGRRLVAAPAEKVSRSRHASVSPASMLAEFPWPPTHGAFRSYLDELRSWSSSRWRKLVTAEGEHELVCQRSLQFLPFPLLDILSRSLAVALYRHSLGAQRWLSRVSFLRGAGLSSVLVTRPRRRSTRRVLFFMEQSGRSRYYDRLFRYFKEHSESELHVASLRPAEPFFEQIAESAARVVSLGKSTRYYSALAKMVALMRGTKPDLVHAHEIIPAFYAALALLLCRSKAKLVYHRHHERTSGLTNKMFDGVATWRASKIVAVSDAMCRLAGREHPGAAHKIGVVHNGIDIEGEASGAPAPRLAAGRKEILLLGRMRPEKGHRVALDAMELVKERLAEASLSFAGTGSLEDELRRVVDERELSSRVRFLGNVDDVAGLLRQADVVVVPSLTEPFGLVAIEAMAAERLVIASRVGGLQEIVEHGRSGILVEPSNPVELADRIVYYLEHADEREALARNGYERYRERFTSAVMAGSYLALYDELLGAE